MPSAIQTVTYTFTSISIYFLITCFC